MISIVGFSVAFVYNIEEASLLVLDNALCVFVMYVLAPLHNGIVADKAASGNLEKYAGSGYSCRPNVHCLE